MPDIGDIVKFPNQDDLVGVVITHDEWKRRYGVDSDGLGPEEWPDDQWVGVWFPTENDMVGQYGDLDRAGQDFWIKVPESEAISRLVAKAIEDNSAPALALNIVIN